MAARSAGILMYRRDGGLQVLLVHPGGPFWAKRDAGAWSIPKGEHDLHESPWAAALREFEEETGVRPPPGVPLPLGEVVQPSRKRITAFALEGDLDVGRVASNLCHVQWPPRSGQVVPVPEIDRAEWFPVATAKEKIVPGQRPFLDRLLERLGS